MNTRLLLVSAGVAALIIAGYAWYVRDLPVYASADAPLAAPIDSVCATLSSAKPIDSGFVAALLPSRTVMDSVGRQLGAEVLAARDACGGRARPGLPELTIGR